MTPKIKLAIKILAVVLVIVFTSFITKKSEKWFPPATEIKVVFEDCVFSEVPALRPIKDQTTYYFKGCRLNGQDFGETITPSEVDEAIAKLEGGKK
jgi:hypothetical protein